MGGPPCGNLPLALEAKLEVWDSPNSAGVVIDAIRCCKLAMDRRLAGAIEAPSAYFMKAPPKEFTDQEAREAVERFIRGPGRTRLRARPRSRAVSPEPRQCPEKHGHPP